MSGCRGKFTLLLLIARFSVERQDGVEMRIANVVYIPTIVASLQLPGSAFGYLQPISFAEETHRADLLNRVSTTVFSALEEEQDEEKESIADVAKSAFKSAFLAVLRSLKGTVAETCNELADIAQRKIQNAEPDAQSAESADEYDFVLSFAQTSTEKKRQTRVRPHRYLETDMRFFGKVQALAKKALLGIASSLKNILKDALLPILPQIKQQAVVVFRKACEEAENTVLEAY